MAWPGIPRLRDIPALVHVLARGVGKSRGGQPRPHLELFRASVLMMFIAPPVVIVPGAASADPTKPAWMPTAVEVDADFQRVAGLPRMEWQDDPNLEQIVRTITNMLRLPGPPCSTCNGQWYSMEMRGLPPSCPGCGRPALKPIQCAVLYAFYENRGVFASMRVGSGKTIPTLLGPTLIGAQRPGLIVKADLREKTVSDIREISKWWRVHPAFQAVATMRKVDFDQQRTLLSYEQIQVKSGGVKLMQAAWDCMMLDEFQAFKDRSTARAKKIKRSQKHFKPITGAFSGSVSTRGFGDFWGPMRWALGAASPLPLELKSFLSWCYSLDEKTPEAARLHPGPLVDLTPGAKGRDDWEKAQDAFGKRFVSAPGVISTKDDVPPVGLEIEIVLVAAPQPIKDAIGALRRDWATPDGNEFEHAFELWSRERWMTHGGWFCWDPPPPDEWRQARKMWHAFVRAALREHSRIVDQPSQVEDAIAAGKIQDNGLLDWWREVEPSFAPNSTWRWLPAGSYVMLEDSINWLRKNPRHAICWAVQEPVGQAVADAAGVPYFGAEGRDARTGQHIMECATSCVASIRSCGTGKNLQRPDARGSQGFYKNNFLELPTTGVAMEQAIGRTHRDGAAWDTVTVRIPVMSEGDRKAIEQVRADCERMQRTEQRPVNFCYGTWYGIDLASERGLL